MTELQHGPFILNVDRDYIRCPGTGKGKHLSAQQYAVTRCLFERKGEMVRNEDLYDAIRRVHDSNPKPEIINVLIHYIRKKFAGITDRGGEYIITEYGVGAWLSDTPVDNAYGGRVGRKKTGTKRKLRLMHREHPVDSAVPTSATPILSPNAFR